MSNEFEKGLGEEWLVYALRMWKTHFKGKRHLSYARYLLILAGGLFTPGVIDLALALVDQTKGACDLPSAVIPSVLGAVSLLASIFVFIFFEMKERNANKRIDSTDVMGLGISDDNPFAWVANLIAKEVEAVVKFSGFTSELLEAPLKEHTFSAESARKALLALEHLFKDYEFDDYRVEKKGICYHISVQGVRDLR